MASLPGPKSRDVQEMIRHLKWSHAEKQIARKAFELAVDREFRNVLRRASVRTEYREADPRGPHVRRNCRVSGKTSWSLSVPMPSFWPNSRKLP